MSLLLHMHNADVMYFKAKELFSSALVSNFSGQLIAIYKCQNNSEIKALNVSVCQMRKESKKHVYKDFDELPLAKVRR